MTAPGPAGHPAARKRARRALVALLAVVVVAAGGVAGYRLSRPSHRSASQGHAAPVPPQPAERAAGGTGKAGRSTGRATTHGAPHRPTGVSAHAFVPPAVTLLATTHGTIPKFAYPGGPESGRVPGRWHEGKSTLPVIARRPGWLDVRLAQRPNESTAWVLARDVTLTYTRYAIVIDPSAARSTSCPPEPSRPGGPVAADYRAHENG